MIEKGFPAPEFTLPATGGRTIRLSDYRGRHLVLYFYPRDDTPGCTTQAKAFSELKASFESAGAGILGVSRDSLAKHEKFREKHGLSIDLASDAEATTCEDYGVWVEKNMYGRKSMGIARTTFLIGPDSAILDIWPKVKVSGHADMVLSRLVNGSD